MSGGGPRSPISAETNTGCLEGSASIINVIIDLLVIGSGSHVFFFFFCKRLMLVASLERKSTFCLIQLNGLCFNNAQGDSYLITKL